MNNAALDRALCERLGIEPEDWKLENHWKLEAVYPALSTSGDGMLRLMQELKSVEHVGVGCHLRIEQKGAYVRTAVEFGLIRSVSEWTTETSAPLALALAAAKALGIEVPE